MKNKELYILMDEGGYSIFLITLKDPELSSDVNHNKNNERIMRELWIDYVADDTVGQLDFDAFQEICKENDLTIEKVFYTEVQPYLKS